MGDLGKGGTGKTEPEVKKTDKTGAPVSDPGEAKQTESETVKPEKQAPKLDDLRDRVRDEQTYLETLMGAIRGFQGYQDRENRRDADKLLRMHLVGLLNDAGEHLSRLQTRLSSEG